MRLHQDCLLLIDTWQEFDSGRLRDPRSERTEPGLGAQPRSARMPREGEYDGRWREAARLANSKRARRREGADR